MIPPKYFLSFLWVNLLSIQSALAFNTDTIAQCYQAAYPNSVQYEKPNILIVNGQRITIEPPQQSFEQALNHATLADQLSQRYARDFLIPSKNEDAGRFRNLAFFHALYGQNEHDIRKNLTQIIWQPSGKKLSFHQANHAAKALENVGKEIAQFPELANYMKKSSGTFNYRFIAGTKRLSTHAFGIAIDFELPQKLGRYWRWDKCKNPQEGVCPFPKETLEDKNLNRIVEIFEKHGFIWGGKWYHYDGVHFEYRPELLHKACQSLGESL
ncbi:MAG: M15 family metallopeptidase [Cardiobacteriaceae bacterium]|nr:M15 family metallopeptidase [Cardiobacteriaceae bacterium]